MEKEYKGLGGETFIFHDDGIEVKNSKYGIVSYANVYKLTTKTFNSWGKQKGSMDFSLDIGLPVKKNCCIHFDKDELDGMNELYNFILDRANVATKEQNKDHIFKCNVCGQIFCYNLEDIKRNERNATASALSSVGAITSGLFGTRYDMYEQSKMASQNANKVIDYTRCPHCNSQDIVEVTDDEIKNNSKKDSSSSSADEIKKFKELLDMGAITQEEFDKKKKELLNS